MFETIEALAQVLAATQGYAWNLLTDDVEDDGPNTCREDFRAMAEAAIAFISTTDLAA